MRKAAERERLCEFGAVKRHLTGIIKRELAPARVVKVNMREGENLFDGRPIFQVDIIFDAERLDPEKLGGMMLAVQDHLWDINHEREPEYKLLPVEEAEDYYARR